MVNDSTVVNGVVGPTRNSDTLYLTYLNSALRALYSVRPDAFIGNFSQGILSAVTILTYDTSDLQAPDGVPNSLPPVPATPFPADDRFFFNPVVAYIAGRVELSDDDELDVLPDQTRDDSDTGWGEWREPDDDARLTEERPPHW